MNKVFNFAILVLLWLALFPSFGFSIAAEIRPSESSYEIWAIDQSDSSPIGGGRIYIYDGPSLTRNSDTTKPEIINLGGLFTQKCVATEGIFPRRPHTLYFTKDAKYAIISFVMSGHVLFMDTGSRRVIGCVLIAPGLTFRPTEDMTMALGVNLGDKRIARIWTNYAQKLFIYHEETDAVPPSAIKDFLPEATPLCIGNGSPNQFAFVSSQNGNMSFDITSHHLVLITTLPTDCGAIEVDQTTYLATGGGWPTTVVSNEVYAVPSSGLPAARIRGSKGGDLHGIIAVNQQYLWVSDRHLNEIKIFDVRSDNAPVGTVQLVGTFSNDPAPDTLVVSPDGHHVFVSFRGPSPTTGNHEGVNDTVGTTPGIGVIRVENDGASGKFLGIARISNPGENTTNEEGDIMTTERADPHALQVLRK